MASDRRVVFVCCDGLGRDWVRPDLTPALAALRAGPGLVYGYHASLDTTAHLFGIDSPQWMDAAAVVDALLTRLVQGLPEDAALLVTADHGGLDVPAEHVGERRRRAAIGRDGEIDAGAMHEIDGGEMAGRAQVGDRERPLVRRLLRRLPVFTACTGNITERHGLRDRSELPEWTFSLSIGVRIRRPANKGALASHPVVRRMLRMVDHLNGRHLARYRGGSLAERGYRAKK